MNGETPENVLFGRFKISSFYAREQMTLFVAGDLSAAELGNSAIAIWLLGEFN